MNKTSDECTELKIIHYYIIKSVRLIAVKIESNGPKNIKRHRQEQTNTLKYTKKVLQPSTVLSINDIKNNNKETRKCKLITKVHSTSSKLIII